MSSAAIAKKLGRILNLRAFAVESGIPRRTLYHVMNGTHEPTKRTLEKITAALAKHKPPMRSAEQAS